MVLKHADLVGSLKGHGELQKILSYLVNIINPNHFFLINFHIIITWASHIHF